MSDFSSSDRPPAFLMSDSTEHPPVFFMSDSTERPPAFFTSRCTEFHHAFFMSDCTTGLTQPYVTLWMKLLCSLFTNVKPHIVLFVLPGMIPVLASDSFSGGKEMIPFDVLLKRLSVVAESSGLFFFQKRMKCSHSASQEILYRSMDPTTPARGESQNDQPNNPLGLILFPVPLNVVVVPAVSIQEIRWKCCLLEMSNVPMYIACSVDNGFHTCCV